MGASKMLFQVLATLKPTVLWAKRLLRMKSSPMQSLNSRSYRVYLQVTTMKDQSYGTTRIPKTVLPKEESHINNQAACFPHDDGNTMTTDGKDTRIDKDHDGMDGTDDADEELLQDLRQELGILEARKATRPWRFADVDETRLQSLTQRINKIEAKKTESDSKSHEDESRARAAAQNLMGGLTVNGFLSLAKGSDTKHENPGTTSPSEWKRKVTESSDPDIGPGPVPKKQRVAKTAGKRACKSNAKAGSVASLPNLLKFNGNGEEKINKKILKDLPTISRAPTHLQPKLRQVHACAMRRSGVDKDTIEAHVRLLVFSTKIFSQQLKRPSVSETNGDDKTLDDYKWSINGMNHPLYHHQLIAAAIMITTERNTDKPHSRSGLLFDHMGYGKTIEALTLIKMNPPDTGTTEEDGERLTVVVCPTSAGRQWVREINNHCHGMRTALWYETLEATKATIFALDVLVVTYDRLRELHKKGAQNPKLKSALFQARLHRLILDEIHEIKSPKADSVTFRACKALTAKHYWGLSGTPTPNGIEELYPYLLFINHPNITTLKAFKAFVVGGTGRQALSIKERNSNLTTLLGPYAILRTPKHRFLGQALVNLPESIEAYKNVQLAKEEKVIYEEIDSDMKHYITNKASKRGNKRSKKTKDCKQKDKLTWASLYESALRFRQCVASPLLLESLVKDGIWTRDQVQAMKEKAISKGCRETPFIDMIKRWIGEPNDVVSQQVADAQRFLSKHRCPGCRRLPDEKEDPKKDLVS